MKNKGLKGFIKGFSYAFKGISEVIKSERNMRIHIAAALNVLIFAPFLNVSRGEFALLLLLCALVISLEGVNSAIERLCDRITREKDSEIGKIKDIAAGSVLVSAIFSVIIGFVVLFKPYEIAALFTGIFTNPVYAVLFVVFEVILGLFVILL